MPIDRTGAQALINVQNSTEIFETAVNTSAALRTFRTIPMTAKQSRMPVIDVLPTAGFVTGEGNAAVKPQANVAWVNKVLEAEEIATIVVIPENVFEDSSYNIWEAIRPRIAEAVGAALDGAVFFGTNKPASWPVALVPASVAAGNVISATDNAGDLAADLDAAISLVEADGYDPQTVYSNRVLRSNLRTLRDSTGQPIYNPSLRDGLVDTVYGLNIEWVRNGGWVAAGGTNVAPTGARALVGDSQMAIIGLRQDMTLKILSEATVGGVSLAETDQIGLRVKMRVAFQIADPTTSDGGTAAFPFAVVRT